MVSNLRTPPLAVLLCGLATLLQPRPVAWLGPTCAALVGNDRRQSCRARHAARMARAVELQRSGGETKFEVIFQPGRVGMVAVWSTGEVVTVLPNGMADREGVQEGWFFDEIDGQKYSEQLIKEYSHGQQVYSVTFKESWHAGPADIVSLPGKRAHHVLWQNPSGLSQALEQELTALQQDSDGDQQVALDGALRQVRWGQRCRAVSELLYLMVCDGLLHTGAPPVQSLHAGGEVRFGPWDERALTSSVHSEVSLGAVQEHLFRSLEAIDADTDGLLQVPLFNVGQAYAMSLLFGYVLRRAAQRFALERLLDSACGDGLEAGRALQRYIEEVIGPGTFQDMMATEESQTTASLQVQALFGDLKALRRDILQRLAPGARSGTGTETAVRRMELRGVLAEGEVPCVRLVAGDLRRLLLEAVAFGSLLQGAEKVVSSVYELTPATETRLDEFGVDTDESGCPILPK